MKRFAALLALLALVAGGCSRGDDDNNAGADAAAPAAQAAAGTEATTTTLAPEPPADAPAVGPDIVVVATPNAFDAPQVVTGGVVNLTFRNAAKVRHEALLVRVGDEGKATGQKVVTDDLDKFVNSKGNPVAPYLGFSGGVGALAPGTEGTASLKLPAGEYAIVCTLTDLDSVRGAPVPEGANAPEHYTKGYYARVSARGANGATLPAGNGTITAADYAFTLPATTPGVRTFVLANDGPAQTHLASLSVFAEGVTEEAGRAALTAIFGATPEAPPPAGTPQPEEVAFAGPVGPGGAVTFSAVLEPGRAYALSCFMFDREGGLPHAVAKKMWTVFGVS